MKSRILIAILVFVLCSGEIFAQSPSNIDKKILFRKEWSAYLFAHTGGWGFGYRNGKHHTYFRKGMWEVEFSTMKHPKEKKVISDYENSRSFIFGKLNSLYIFRGGYGVQRVLNGKPYWGGVEFRWFFFGGGNLTITKPVYLYIVRPNADGLNDIYVERYNPNEHDIGQIFGRGPFFKGFDHLGFYPAIYAKTGFNFEYGAYDTLLKAIECGVTLDFYPIPVPLMAFNNKESFFLSMYISIHLGKRKN